MTKELPDVTQWKPKSDRQEALRNTFLQTCRSIEARIIAESNIEKKFSINNFDAGPGIEDIVREQFKLLMPDRYSVMPGVIIDGLGNNCGECDIVIVNEFWVPLLKYGATEESRRVHIPAEAVYSVIEVKQTLTEESLDKAMEKIVTYKRLMRSRSEFGRVIENHNIAALEDMNKSLNYRFDAIVGVSCKEGEVEKLIQRFFEINELLLPSERVNALVLLGYGYVCYVKKNDVVDGYDEYLYPEDTSNAIFSACCLTSKDSFYYLWVNLWHHLTLTVLNFGHFKHRYGFENADKQVLILPIDKK